MNAAVTESDHKLSLNDQLRDKYQLKTEPFGEATSLFFQGAQRQHNLETLRHLVSYGDMVLVLTGASGSGKSTLISELGRHIVDGIRVIALNPTLIASPRKLTFELCKRLDLQLVEGEPVSRTMARVLDACAHNAAKSERLLLVVDDAHKINKDSFKLLLSTFRDLGSDSGICLLVSGRQEILQSITQEGVDPTTCSWIHQIHLKPFSQDDAETYVRLRLARAGSKVEPVLTDVQKKALSVLGKGCPGRINRIAPAVLLDSFELASPKKSSPKGLSWLLVGIVASLLVSFAVIGHQYNLFSSSDVERVTTGEVVRVESRVANDAQGDLLAKSREEIDIKLKQAEIKAGSLPAIAELIDVGAVEGNVGDDLAVAATEAQTVSSSISKPTVDVAGEPVYTAEGVIQASPIVEDIAKPEKVEKAPTTKPVAPEVSAEKVELSAKTEKLNREGEANAIVNNATVSTRHSRFRGGDWVSTQSKGSYTIQVLGSRNEQTATKYIDSERASKELLYIESTYKEKPWFVVLLGVYPNKAAAKAEMARLPRSIKKQKPWVRSLEGL
ncbi:AAA family ATPase [Alkalimarinus alittae]|uniref:AAA family ATPase n=1 Tax=Alkalimarinus alittae TaxID=2961619 RepID=A0ABY6N0K3_9ALTE|nr:AAA family ATPase [Alkalimarinus alittae]UZE95633.1 AAA family ATPase [Alkalimarinus alittae]